MLRFFTCLNFSMIKSFKFTFCTNFEYILKIILFLFVYNYMLYSYRGTGAQLKEATLQSYSKPIRAVHIDLKKRLNANIPLAQR